MKIDFSRVKSMALKEYKHIIRDKFTVIAGFGFPVFVVIVFGFMINLNYENIDLYVKDESMTKQSRMFVDSFSHNGYFNVKYVTEANPVKYLENNETAAVMVINSDFGKKVSALMPARVQMLLDGSDNIKAALAAGYLTGILNSANENLYPGLSDKPLNIETRFLFNPELRSRWFIVPGLIVVIIGLLAILLTSLTIAREWEKGSMELLLSARIRPVEIILGKIVPYFVLNIIAVITVFFIAAIVFAVPFTGSIIAFFAACCVYIIACLAWGILISAVTRQQQLAMMIAMVVGLLPSVLLSGFIFSIENMPLFFRYFTCILPQRWFMEICRGVFLRGAGFSDLAVPFAMICFFCVIMIVLASKKFKTDVEP